jgi:multidrug resistance efflux pump
MKWLRLLIVLAIVGGAVRYVMTRPGPTALTLTGIVTTNDVIVSPQIGGQIEKLLVNEGETVTRNQLIALIGPAELKADSSYYEQGVQTLASQVKESEAALRFQQRQTEDQIQQAEAELAATIAQQGEANAALENARINLDRSSALLKAGVGTTQDFDQARTAYDGAKARLDALLKQADVQRAAVTLARSSSEQDAVKQNELVSSEHQRAAAISQKTKADVRLSYTEIRAPIAGIVDVRAARTGEVVNLGQPVVTLIDPDDLWVRADVEETYIDRIRIGDKLRFRLPSGEERSGTVFYRSADAGFATQRDVSRTKRDIKTFEIRLRVDNSDRRLAVGMTAYVLLPIQ